MKNNFNLENFKKNWCGQNLKSKNPRICPICKSKYLYYDNDAGPIIDGFGTVEHPPNAHRAGAWICMDCQEIAWKN